MRPDVNPRTVLECGTFVWIVFAAQLVASSHPLRHGALWGVVALCLASIWMRRMEEHP